MTPMMLAFYKIMDLKAVLAYTLKLWKLIWSDPSRVYSIDVKMTELDRIRDQSALFRYRVNST